MSGGFREVVPPGRRLTRRAGTRIRELAARVDAATPADRDRTVDALRALAIAGVILGHWMVTALVLTRGRAGGSGDKEGGTRIHSRHLAPRWSRKAKP